jgi:plastocyanin
MKKSILSLLLLAIVQSGFSKTWTVVSSGMTFSPATVTINQGDSVRFTLDASHNAVEVSQTVWNANGTTSNNGFSIAFGGGLVLPAKLTTGTHYYVCTPHASLGMKGKIVVQTVTGLSESLAEGRPTISINPADRQLEVHWNLGTAQKVQLSLLDVQGRRTAMLLPATTLHGEIAQSFMLPSGTTAGLYFVECSVGNRTSYQKVLVR